MGATIAIFRSFTLLGCIIITSARSHAADYQTFIQQGRAALDARESQSAIVAFTQALEQMPAEGRPTRDKLIALIGLSTAYMDIGELSKSERSLLAAQDVAVKTDDLATVELASNWATLHARLGHHAEAQSELIGALAIAEQSPAARSAVPILLQNLATAEIRLGKYLPAILHQQRAIEIWSQWVPASESNLVKSYNGLATAQFLSHQDEAALASLEKSIAVAESRFGKNSPIRARLLQDELIVLTRLGLKREFKARKRELSQMRDVADPPAKSAALAATVTQSMLKQ